MKRLATAVLITFGAFGLHAADQTTTAAPTSTQLPVDSPLVRAAKTSQSKTSSKTKKKIVITNETLAKSGGHITTSHAQAPLPPPTPDTNILEMERQKQVAAQRAAADKTKKDAEAKQKREQAQRVNAVLEGDDPSMGLEDPAVLEGTAEKVSPAPPAQPPTMQTQKPPAS